MKRLMHKSYALLVMIGRHTQSGLRRPVFTGSVPELETRFNIGVVGYEFL